MTKYRDLFKQARRMGKQITEAEQPAVFMAYDLFIKALEKAARRSHAGTLQPDGEYLCVPCGTRWEKNEPDTDCAPLVSGHDPILVGPDWKCATCGAVWAMGEQEPAECREIL